MFYIGGLQAVGGEGDDWTNGGAGCCPIGSDLLVTMLGGRMFSSTSAATIKWHLEVVMKG
jgi:hypothetical protein